MKKQILIPVVMMVMALAFSACSTNKKPAQTAQEQTHAGSFHDFTVTDIDGKEFKMAELKGKKVMVVNVASKCGFTPQYEPLQKLYEKYRNQDFVVIGFPANNFMSQEPGTNEEIKEFCTSTYQVTFPMMAKVSVKGGDIHPVYAWLTQKSLNGMADSDVKWNFQKYMISEEGKLVGMAGTRENPDAERIIRWIEKGDVPGF
jgi:glutathione peroxidase